MIITIDTTQELSKQDVAVLQTLVNVQEWQDPSEESPPPAKKAATKKPAKKAAAAAPKDEPADDDDTDALRAKAVEAARDLLEAGEREKVMSVLSSLEVSRVSDLPDESLADFLTALEA
jgi:hypothetical protein